MWGIPAPPHCFVIKQISLTAVRWQWASMHNIRILDVSYLYAIIFKNINAFMTGRNMHYKSPVPRLIQICSVNFIMKTFRRLFFDLVYHEFKLQLNPSSSFFSQCVTLRYPFQLKPSISVNWWLVWQICFLTVLMVRSLLIRKEQQGAIARQGKT